MSSVIPDRSIFEGKRYLKIGLVEAARGCPFKCDFCAIQTYFKSTQTRRPIETVLAEVQSLKETGNEMIFFVDDNIVGNITAAKELFKALTPLHIRWVSQASITAAYDEELLTLMRQSGCYGLLIGFESLNEQNLRKMNKEFNAARGGFETALKTLRKHKIRLYPTFVFGYPDDDEKAFDQTVRFCKKHRFLVAAFNHLTPFPGTPLYKRLEQEGTLKYEKWWLDDRYRYGEAPMDTKHLTGKEIRDRCVKARKQFYSIFSIGRRMLNRVNCHDAFSVKAFLALNLMFRQEVSIREGYPLGDESFKGPLIKVKPEMQRTVPEQLVLLGVSS